MQFIDQHSQLRKLSELFDSNGFHLFAVGGCVRDHLLNVTPKDIDLVTDATPDQVEAIVKTSKEFGSVPIGKQHGIILVVSLIDEDAKFDVATFRKDIGSGRRPDSVEFTDATTDVTRRDFTINALLLDLKSDEIFDFVGGGSDLADRILKTVGDPKLRFEEDSLRKLRAIRFKHSLSLSLDEDTRKALKANPSLAGVSKERIVDEFTKMVKKCQSLPLLISDLKVFGLDKEIFETKIQVSRRHTNKLEVALVRMLKHLGPKMIVEVLKKCKFSVDTISKVSFLMKMLDFKDEDVKDLKKKQLAIGLDSHTILDFAFSLPMTNVAARMERFARFELTIKSQQVIDLGFKGEEVGRIMSELETKKFIQW